MVVTNLREPFGTPKASNGGGGARKQSTSPVKSSVRFEVGEDTMKTTFTENGQPMKRAKDEVIEEHIEYN